MGDEAVCIFADGIYQARRVGKTIGVAASAAPAKVREAPAWFARSLYALPNGELDIRYFKSAQGTSKEPNRKFGILVRTVNLLTS